jgi:hypothetical protein
MSHITRSGNAYRIHAQDAMDISKILPAEIYAVNQDIHGLFLEKISPFELPPRIYGKTVSQAKRILNTYQQRTVNTGVLLAGEKGSGKTLLAKYTALEALKLNLPVIVINKPYTGDNFNQLIQSIDQPAVLLFDEFEKVYKEEDQQNILTLLDGVYQTRKLIIFTCNNKWAVDGHMHNRPGRIYYLLEFKGLPVEFIQEYCQVELDNKEHIDSICKLSRLYSEFNFDMLKAIVEEMNRYKETPEQVLEVLNAKPGSGDQSFDIEVQVGGEIAEYVYPCTYDHMPLGQEIQGYYHLSLSDGSDDTDRQAKVSFTLTDADIFRVDYKTGDIIYVKGKATITFKRKMSYYGGYSHLF